jgi:glucan phosphoethanolaminetransferase (alkaline phosphatase superfamily)
MSMLVTSPCLGYAVAPREKSPLAPALWLTVLATALPSLLYQNSGFLQFGYRFSLDYLIFLVMLLAVGGRRFTWLFKVLVVWGIAVNLFGAIVFDRFGGAFAYNDSFFPHGNN